MPIPRPRFDPSPCNGQTPTATCTSNIAPWVPLITCPADFPVQLFEIAVSQLIHHPEYNSTLILRSETVSDTRDHIPEFLSTIIPILPGLQPLRNIHRKLLPRRPTRDASLEQHCTFYGPTSTSTSTLTPTTDDDEHNTSTFPTLPTTLVLTPVIRPDAPLPYYHPPVSHLAFHFITSSDPPTLQIDAVPLPDTPTDLNSRLYRTCLALLGSIHRYGWGALVDYQKRVIHDCLVPRDDYQDLYLVMRERHKHLVASWREVTDPLKHVFEDIGIATYLMLLWKDTFAPPLHHHQTQSSDSDSDPDQPAKQPWRTWPRPPGGFLDLGCGNGLLTHILTAEGYEGRGIDLRARTSWSHYPESTQAHLHVHAFDPLSPPQPPPPPPSSSSPGIEAVNVDNLYFKPGTFFIGNHADELTPWVPVLATLHSASGYLSIPCCAWSFDERYDRSKAPRFPVPTTDFAESLNLGGGGGSGSSYKSSYSMYRIWLASLSLYCGWEVECEVLRIPSTRNWAIVGRRRRVDGNEGEEEVKRRIDGILESVRDRGMFKTRKPEGTARDH